MLHTGLSRYRIKIFEHHENTQSLQTNFPRPSLKPRVHKKYSSTISIYENKLTYPVKKSPNKIHVYRTAKLNPLGRLGFSTSSLVSGGLSALLGSAPSTIVQGSSFFGSGVVWPFCRLVRSTSSMSGIGL